MATTRATQFPNYLERRRWLPIWVWHVLRALSLLATLGFIGVCLLKPAFALQWFWQIVVPLLPLLFWLLPGLWRNLCPLAASNQLPRLFGLSAGFTLPALPRRYAPLVGLAMLFVLIPMRHVLFDHDAHALALLIGEALGLALVGGLFFKGKSGWCGSFCPLLPVQRLYGQTPLAVISNSHCQPCVGCTRNCYDFNPQVAWLADLHDDDPGYGDDRRLLAGILPGLIVAYYTLPWQGVPLWSLYLHFGLYCLIGIGAYWLLEIVLKTSAQRITALFAVACLNIFYFFSAPVLAHGLIALGVPLPDPAFAIALRIAVAAYSLFWLLRTFRKEQAFLAESNASTGPTQADAGALSDHRLGRQGDPLVLVEPGAKKLPAQSGTSLLDLLEQGGCEINAGCRMGACGADPVAVISGADALSPMSARERDTVQRLGYGDGVRMACCAKVQGEVGIHLDPRVAGSSAGNDEPIAVPADLRRIVIVGNGIAGVTAADVLRRHWPDGELHLVGAEKHPLYNRMAISKLIYGRAAMSGLLLMPERWYEERKITTWLNTRVRRIDCAAQKVELATGETIAYDRLILTAGSAAYVPAISGFERPGAFVLRTADDAMAIREYVQRHDCRQAVVAGGGLLGLEAAYALSQLGLRVRVLERSGHLLSRQLDTAGAELLRAYLEGLGLQVAHRAELVAVEGKGKVEQLLLSDGRKMSADLLLVAAGIVPNLHLGRDAGAESGRGLMVDEGMRTSLPNVFAAGDIAEFRERPGEIAGLWTQAVEQGRVAAINALGGEASFQPTPLPTVLKVVGFDMTSIGDFRGKPTDFIMKVSGPGSYRRLVLREGRAVGAILLGQPQLADAVIAAVSAKRDLQAQVEALRAGDWRGLAQA